MAIGQGKAFITVEADLTKFGKDLGREIPRILKDAETAVRAESRKVFGKAGEDSGKSFSRALKKTGQSAGIFSNLAATLANALDDGISALPTEVKAAIVVGMVAALPIIAALLTGAVSVALIAGFAGIGVLLAAQFEEVRQKGGDALDEFRRTLADAGAVFVQPTLDAIESVRNRLNTMSITLGEVFQTASKFIEPVVDALLSFVQAALPGLQEALDNLVPLLPTLVDGAALLGKAVGDALAIITGSDDAQVSLETLFGLLAQGVVGAAALIRAFTELYGLIVKTTPLLFVFDRTADSTIRLRDATDGLAGSTDGVVAASKREEKALKEQERLTKAAKKALDDYVNAQFAFVHAEIDFERALDDLSEAVKENGKSLDIRSEKGRKVSEAILRGIEAARREREEAIASGKKTEEQAEAAYQAELARLRGRATELGIVGKAFDDLAISVGVVNDKKVDVKLSATTKHNIEVIQALITRYLKVFGGGATRFGAGHAPPGVPQLAAGGILDSPTLAVVAEAGPEAVVPLTRPRRAAQIMAQAGLGGTGAVYVYVGDEQLTSRMYRVARGAQRQQAQRLYAGTRMAF